MKALISLPRLPCELQTMAARPRMPDMAPNAAQAFEVGSEAWW